jgi:hypothetical protein
MTSTIAWLDASADEQRRVREIVQLFSQRETQDELGGRRIVVTLSDALFPGTSVLHSRARYVLFIPWFAKVAAPKKDPRGWFEWLERQMIKAFLDDTDVEEADRLAGLIGREAGPKVKQLPSSAYWTALDAWQILTVPGPLADTLRRTSPTGPTTNDAAADELVHRAGWVWHPGVGEPPDGFPGETLDGGFRLKRHEAEWLRERWLATTDGSLLAHLARTQRPLVGGWAPWREPACRSASAEITNIIDEAERFSMTIEGARLLYQLMVAERYVEEGFDRVEPDLDAARAAIVDWGEEVGDRSDLFEGWDTRGFWALVRSRNARIDEITRRFFDVWFDRVVRADVDGIGDDDDLRRTVAAREQFLKRGQARLTNDKMLASWQAGPPRPVSYRWSQVSQLVGDVLEGLEGPGADAGA